MQARELVQLLKKGAVSPREVYDQHRRRIDALDGRLKAFTHVFDYQEPRPGPLHGLPVSLKENLDVAGLPTTFGVASREAQVARRDAAIVTALREAGAVLLGRTNMSQLGLYAESRNPLFGQTANPWSLKHTPGGSSGGEGAAVAAELSPLGVGTDIGGSIRVPAHFCGIAGFKPTLDRLPMAGIASGIPGQEAVRAMCGPLARSARDLQLFFEALDPRRLTQLDGRVPPLSWRSQELGTPRIGLMLEDGLVPPSTAIVRALRKAADALRALGCEVIEWQAPRAKDALFLQLAAMSADGGRNVMRELRGQPIDPVIAALRRIARLPAPVRLGLAAALKDELPARTLRALGRKPVEELWRLTGAIRAWRFEVLESMDAAGIELFLAPPYATPALPHFGSKDFVLAASHSMLWNIAQLPAGVVPAAIVEPQEARREHAPGMLGRLARVVDEQSAGLPVGVQLVGRPWRDEQVLAAMIAVEDALEFRGHSLHQELA